MYIPNNNQAGISDFNRICAQNHMPATIWCQARIGLLPRSRELGNYLSDLQFLF